MSLNVSQVYLQYTFFLFHQVYVHDCTMVSPYPLLFFGGKISILTVTVPALLVRAMCVTQTLFKQISSRSCQHASRHSRNCNWISILFLFIIVLMIKKKKRVWQKHLRTFCFALLKLVFVSTVCTLLLITFIWCCSPLWSRLIALLFSCNSK